MSPKSLTLLLAATVAVSVAGTKYLWPNVQTKTEVVEHETVRKDVVTVVKEVVRPDGTKESTTTIVDRSKETSDSKSTEIKIAARPQWFFQVGAITKSLTDKPDYSLGINRRILGPLFIGANYTTNNNFGLTIGMEF